MNDIGFSLLDFLVKKYQPRSDPVAGFIYALFFTRYIKFGTWLTRAFV
jgi:hypothetical protein